MSTHRLTPGELDRHREVQRLAYRCATEVAGELEAGVTETEAADRLGDALRRAGVRSFFHRPFAWFGDRTAFSGFRSPLDFFPQDTRRLQPGMAAILDVAPIVDGFAADIGYSFSLGDNAVLEQALQDLRYFRELVLDRVSRGDSLGEVYRAVEDLLADLGYVNCHRKYPFGVLAHRVDRAPRSTLLNHEVLGFSVAVAGDLIGKFVRARLPRSVTRRAPWVGASSPFCNVGPGSDRPPSPGLWAFEPHIARGAVGAKWEEMLVVDESGARWLDDDLPHVRRWRATA
jgi:Xaa-Pro aminopeptidase